MIGGLVQTFLRRERVSNEIIEAASHEIKKIRIDTYYRMLHFVRRRPILALVLSSVFALLLGTASSVLASFIYECIK